MTKAFPPETMRAWQYESVTGGLEKNLKLNASAPLPTPKPNQHLVQTIATALNPVDYKPAEVPLAGRMLVPKQATPGIDFAGRIVTPATDSDLKRGQLVFGMAGTTPFAGGALREFTVTDPEGTAPLPDGLDPTDAATIGVAGLTAYQTIVPKAKKGDKIFINGGSGGTGIFGIQIAKAVGCYVVTSCSTPNVEFCRSLGADEVIDYKKDNVVEALTKGEGMYDRIIDNVGGDTSLYLQCHKFTNPKAEYVGVGGSPSLSTIGQMLRMNFQPGFLGGAKRARVGFFAKHSRADLDQIGAWMKEGKVRAVIDHKFTFEQAPEAFKQLKTGRTKGKIVVDVASETYNDNWSE
ncbi:hypothetical protein MMC09_001389 [Bachmanniomyces sp. S44760]|nr:hypothetical protein [Bachmanniomyces sp. S44760]